MALVIKNLPTSVGDAGSIPGLERLPWRRAWQPTRIFLPGESHGQEEPGGLQFIGSKESDMTKAT